MSNSRPDEGLASGTPPDMERQAQATLDALAAHIAVLDEAGTIVAVNRAWRAFAEANPPVWSNVNEGANYLAVCDTARGAYAAEAVPVAAGIRAVIRGERTAFEIEYPCHSGASQRWFTCRVTSCPGPGPRRVVVSHENITARKLAEDALRDSRQLLRQVIDLVPHHLFAKDRDGRFLFINRAAADSIGYPPEEVVGRLERELRTDTEHTENFLRADREVIDRDASKFVPEEEITYPDGTIHFLQTMKIPFTPPGGSERAVMGVAIDITDNKRVERELRASELEFRTMFETASIGMAQTNPQTGRFLRVNSKLCAITGYSADELFRMGVRDLTHADDRDKDWNLFQQVVRGEAPAYRVEKRYVRKDGSIAWVNVNMTVIRDAAGVPQRTMATIEDITERRQAEELRARLAMAVEQSAEAIVITDTDGTIVYVNPSFERISGYTAAEAIGQNPRILQSGRHPREFYRTMWTTLAGGQTWSGHIINRRKDDRLYEESAIISPVLDVQGRIVCYVAVKRDITREAQLEHQLRQAQKMEAVGRLAGGVAHDFNNLLMGIMGYTEMCQNNLEPGHPIREWLDEVMLGARRSADLTRQLLAFASKQVIAPKVLDLNEAVAGMLKMLQRLIGEDIDLAFLPGAHLEPVLIDPSQVDQILANLCVNARDAIAGVGRITLQTANVAIDAAFCERHPEAVPGPYVSLAVGDNGCGMDADTLAQIFEPFFTTKAQGKGTGLGLSTVYGIVRQNDGFITVDCAPGRGATFTIHLPRATATEVETAVPTAAAPPRGHETILLAEDEKAPRETCRLFLQSLGYHVLAAASPADALEQARLHPGDISLLITDVVMPDMDGRQLARQLAVRVPGLRVLFMSGYTPDVVAQRGVRERSTPFIAKPFTRDELAAKVRAVLDGPAP